MTTCNLQPSTCPRCGKPLQLKCTGCACDEIISPLTPRQTEVMREICKGKIGKEIGRDMGVSTRTVETHIQLAKRALGARNIVQAAVLFSKLEPTP